MDPLWLALIAIVVVIVSVLVLRLHAFLALTFGALLVAVFTPRAQLLDAKLQQEGVRVISVASPEFTVEAGKPASGSNLVYRKSPGARYFDQVGEVFLEHRPAELAEPARVTLTQPSLPLEPGDLLVHASRKPSVEKAAQESAGQRVAFGFGDTCRKIGILIAMASVIGTCLLESGAARRVVDTTRDLVGEERTPLAFTISGFVVGIPVFFDTVFYLLMPLARAMRLKTGSNYLLYFMSIVVGATMAHSLVPPTPGPLFVASEIGVNIGTMIAAGTVVGLIAVASGYLYIVWANRVWEIPLRDGPTRSSDQDQAEPASDAVSPPFLISLLPILIPVVLLAGKTFLDARFAGEASTEIPTWLAQLMPAIDFVGDKNIALIIAAVVALATLAWQRHRSGASKWLVGIHDALSSGGVIILITSAGGAFGQALRQCGIADSIQQRFPATEHDLALLGIAFAITAVVRFAQGSATVAMITSVGIVAPLASSISLGYHPVYLALAIGCGSKPLPWMNDSGFWIVGRMSGMTESETLKTVSVTLTIMGVVGFLVTLAGAKWLPMVVS